MELSYEVKIPKERLPILIGTKGRMKRKIERELGVKLSIDSEEGEIKIEGDETLAMYQAREIVKAVGRGFNPEVALQLLKPDFVLEIIPISDFAGKSKNRMLQLKGRVIGTDGQSRDQIEKFTDTNISVYGKTICIIGRYENVSDARRAIESLLSGSQHGTVFRWLEQRQRKRVRQELESKGL